MVSLMLDVRGSVTNVVTVVVGTVSGVDAVVNMAEVVVGIEVNTLAVITPKDVVVGVVKKAVCFGIGERCPSLRNLAKRLLFSSTVPAVSNPNLSNSISSSSFLK